MLQLFWFAFCIFTGWNADRIIPFMGDFMKKLYLVTKILITEQEVKFYGAVCRICEKIERWIMQYR